ncbi:MAG: AMP-binding protein [Burkholderiaceae bacterium]|nr:AMP-binding protein [Burkholderiaceae bacterium]
MGAMLPPLEVLRLYRPHAGTVASLLDSRAAAAPQRECLVFEQQSIGYAQLRERVGRAAAWLQARGVRTGDRIGVMSTNHPSTVVLLLALARIGAVMVPVNPDYKAAEAGYVFGHAEVSGILCSPDALPTVRAAIAALPQAPWLVLNRGANDVLPVFDDELDALRDAAVPPDAQTPDAPCVFIYTSGTTGFPKGVMHGQRSLILAGEGFVARMYLQPDDRLLCILPMFHINALFYSLAGALAAGATLILVPRFSASTFWHDAARTRATEANTIAAVSNILLRRPRSEFVPGHTLRKIYGAPFTAETYDVFQREFGVPTLIEGYGMSEIPGALNNPFEGPHKIGSMGRPSVHPDPAVQLARLKVVDDDGRELPDGEVGELVVKTPLVMQGYYRDAEQTRAAFRDGWFLTGDLARRDADGYFWFIARKKDIIRKRGENISGAELDRVVESHPQVLQAAAIPVPDALGEDEILIAVVPRPGATVTPHEVADWCRKHLAAIKVPRYVAIVESLPLTPTHRVAKYQMRADAGLRARATDLSGR